MHGCALQQSFKRLTLMQSEAEESVDNLYVRVERA